MGCHIAEQFESVPAHVQSYSCSTVPGTGCPRAWTTQIGHFVANDQTVERGGFRAVFWDAPKDLRNAVEDIVVLLEYLRNLHRNIRQGTTSQLLVLCNRTAVQNQLLQQDYECRPPHQLQVLLPSLLS